MSVLDDYLESVTQPQKNELERIRKIVKELAPEAEEVISYGMPGFKYHGKYVVGFAAFRDHLSLFPTAKPIAMLEKKLQPYKISKGTIQFTEANPIPEQLIKELVKIRLADI